MLSNTVLLAFSLGGLALTVLLILLAVGFFANTKKVGHADPAELIRGKRGGGLAALRKRKARQKRNIEREEDIAVEEANHGSPNEAEGAQDHDVVEPRAMTKKERQKEIKRREREELRQFDQQQRQARQQKAEEKEAEYQRKRDAIVKLEVASAEHERTLQQEKERKEMEEFAQWKDEFQLEEKGWKQANDSEESQTLLQQFIDYVKKHKVVLLEDLAIAFNMATQEASDRIEALQATHCLTGIVDDRGKFIYITEEEMEAVAKFIQRRGRLGLAELSNECNKLIRFDGTVDQNATSAFDWLHNEDNADESASCN